MNYKRMSAEDLGAIGITLQQVFDASCIMEDIEKRNPSQFHMPGFSQLETLVIIGEAHGCGREPVGHQLVNYCDACNERVIMLFTEH